MTHCWWLDVICVALVTLASSARAQTNYASSSIPPCTGGQLTHFDLLGKTMGVEAVDADGADISIYAPQYHVVAVWPRDWRPFFQYKQVYCGNLDHFKWYHTIFIPGEEDWNNVIRPTAEFKPMFDDAKRLVNDVSELPACVKNVGGESSESEATSCTEMEITPGSQFYRNYFFDKHDLDDECQLGGNCPKSKLENQTMCFYGPWVNDEVHGTHPEVHPSQLVWWQAKQGATDLDQQAGWWLAAITDESYRFDKRDQYPHAPNNEQWLPWAAKPLHAKFQFLLAHPLADAPVHEFSLSSSLDTMGLEPIDLQHQGSISMSVDGQPVFVIHKNDLLSDGMRVTFTDVCRNGLDNSLDAIAEMEMRLGSESKRHAGSALIHLVEGANAPPRAPLGNAENAELRFIPDSLRREQQRIIGDFELSQSSKTHLMDFALPSSRTTTRSSRCQALENRCVSMILLSKNQTENTFDFEGRSTRRLPIAIHSRVTKTEALGPAPHAEVRTSKWGTLRSTENVQFQRVPGAKLLTSLEYVALKDGHASPEDSSEIEDELNERLASKDFAAFFGGLPFQIEDQHLTVWDETTCSRIPTRTGTPPQSDDEASAVLRHVVGASWELNVTFPKTKTEHLYHAIYTAKVTDNFGDPGEINQDLWNHRLQFNNALDKPAAVDQLLQIVGLTPEDLKRAAAITDRPTEFWGTAPDSSRRAQMVLQRSRQVAELMGASSFGDLEKLLNLVHLYTNPNQTTECTAGE